MNTELDETLRKRIDDFLDGHGDESDIRDIVSGFSQKEFAALNVYIQRKSTEMEQRSRAVKQLLSSMGINLDAKIEEEDKKKSAFPAAWLAKAKGNNK